VPQNRISPWLILAPLTLAATPAAARVEPATVSLTNYVQARAAASAGAYRQASQGYAAALAANPGNEVIAAQALTHSVTAGDWPLALRAARLLESRNALRPDARFLLVADAFRRRDWRAAGQQLDAVEREQLFSFAVPAMRAWLAYGSGRGDPLAMLPDNDAASAASAYAAEQRPLLLIAMRRTEGVQQLLAAPDQSAPRTVRLRLAGAATLAGRGDRAAALSLLQGDETPIVAARNLLDARRPLRGGMTAAAGLGEVLTRLSLDMNNQELTAVAASFARLAAWASPEDGQAWLIAAELYGQQERRDAAIDLLSNVPADDPYAASARDQRIRLLVQSDQDTRALAEAEAAAGASTAGVADYVRLGDVLMDQNRPVDAARAYGRAQDVHHAGDSDFPEWALWLFRGSAFDRARDWPQARGALEQAYRLAPEQPLVLNYLGYAQLERRENLVEAERLVREAHRLAPDNAAITDSLGWALFLKGSLGEAIPLLEQAAQGEPADVEINEHLGDAYYAAGRRVDARYAWAAALVYAESEDATRLRAKIDRGLTHELAAR
jgi:tetratricopeptide (TPR) repeat protein